MSNSILIDHLAVNVVLTNVESGTTLSWQDDDGRARTETYQTLAHALVRLAVIHHMKTEDRDSVDTSPQRSERRIDAFLAKATRPRTGKTYPWHGWNPSKRIVRSVRSINLLQDRDSQVSGSGGSGTGH